MQKYSLEPKDCRLKKKPAVSLHKYPKGPCGTEAPVPVRVLKEKAAHTSKPLRKTHNTLSISSHGNLLAKRKNNASKGRPELPNPPGISWQWIKQQKQVTNLQHGPPQGDVRSIRGQPPSAQRHAQDVCNQTMCKITPKCQNQHQLRWTTHPRTAWS